MIKKFFSIKFIRFSISGGIATAIDFGLLYIFVQFLDIWYIAAAIPAFLIGSLIHFLISYFWVFEDKNKEKIWKKYLKFTSIHILSLGINLICMYFFVEVLGMNYLTGKIAAIVGSVIWNFCCNKKFTF
jgi:putative flippase GtrA